MCAAALRQIGVGRIVFGCGNAKFGGCGTVLNVISLPEHSSSSTDGITGGVLATDAVALLRRFYAAGNTRSEEGEYERAMH